MQSLLICVAVVFVAGAHGQHIPACQDHVQCPSDKYCSSDTHFCIACIHCEDLNRESPRVPTPCVRSIAECGPCLKGLSEEPSGEAGAACVLPATGASAGASTALPAYAWVIIALAILLFIGFVAAVLVYILRNTVSLKILASTRTSVEMPPAADGIIASAPPPQTQPPPPPYNDFAPVRPNSPMAHDAFHNEDEFSRPLVKRAPSTERGGRPADARETAGNQEARVFNNPAYVRGPFLPPSYDSAESEPEPQPEPSTAFEYHDEDTMESSWTPVSEPSSGDAAAAGNEGAVAVPSIEPGASGSQPQPTTVARRAWQDPGPPAKLVCVREDSNNNHERPSTERGESSGARATIVMVNVNVN